LSEVPTAFTSSQMLGYNGGNGCIDALLTHNFKPCCVNMHVYWTAS